jgi:hypothetical protein
VATNFFFNNFQSSQEQSLFENLIIESIKIYGEDMYYIPRRLDNIDQIYGESSVASFDTAYFVEMYINSVDGFSGDGNFLSKFGLEIRDQVTFTIAQRVFNEEIDVYESTTLHRPREGDLVYFPLNQKCFQIKYVNNKPFFYQMGALQTFELVCELFEYSGESMNTGIEEIDKLQKNNSIDILDYGVTDEDGLYLMDEDGDYIVNEKYNLETIDPNADNDYIQEQSDEFLDFSEYDPFSENGRY